MSLDSVSYAVKEIIRKEERFPVVAKIREYARAYSPPVNRKPIIPEEYQIEEFSEASPENIKEAEAFFAKMKVILSDKMGGNA